MPGMSVSARVATVAPSASRRSVAAVSTVDRTANRQVDRLADPGPVRRVHAVDEHLAVPIAGGQRNVEAGAGRRSREHGLLGGAGRVVAVGEEHEPLLRAGRGDGRRETHRCTDVGRPHDRHRLRRGELGDSRREAVDEGIGAEDDDPGGVALRHLAHGGPRGRHERIPRGVDHARAAVHEEHDAQPVGGQREPRAGRGRRSGRRSAEAQDEATRSVDRQAAPRGHRQPPTTTSRAGSESHSQAGSAKPMGISAFPCARPPAARCVG